MKKEVGVLFGVLFFILIGIAGCDDDSLIVILSNEPDKSAEQASREITHGKSAPPDYEVVFSRDVKRIDISLDPIAWQKIIEDMTKTYGEFGVPPAWLKFVMPGLNMKGQIPGTSDEIQQNAQQNETMLADFQPLLEMFKGLQLPEGITLSDFQNLNGTGSPGVELFNLMPSAEYLQFDPIWQPCNIVFDGLVWEHVGFRLKGLSTLMSGWWRGNMKLPFRIDFDEFEDDYPEIKNQRFYGFKKLTFSPGLSDDALIREKVAADIFREAGVPAPMTAFYRVYIDFGEGPVYFGLYTMVEDPDGPMLDTQFSDGGGNLYKPEGKSATFAKDGFDAKTITKKTNKKKEDWSDIEAVFEALHASNRVETPNLWRKNLESVFNVEAFLRWLAVNTLIENWDTYGNMSHNYYLYGEPKSDGDDVLVHWIPWDNNMSLTLVDKGYMPPVSISLDDVTSEWPLIRYLMDDPVYKTRYAGLLEETINGVFELERIQKRYQDAHDLIREYVVGENGELPGYTHLSKPEAFDEGLQGLFEHAKERQEEARHYLLEMQAQ